jgi:hypothetical protein
MIAALPARWLLTVVFVAAGVAAALPWRGPAAAAGRAPAVSCVVMCAALAAMTWWSEPAAAAWAQAAVFGCAALWPGLGGTGRDRRPGLLAVLHGLMAGAMIWMLIALPPMAGMPPAGSAGGAMASVSRHSTPGGVLAISILLAVSCAVAAISWLARAIGPGPRVKDQVSASQAAMSAGMAAMLFATL